MTSAVSHSLISQPELDSERLPVVLEGGLGWDTSLQQEGLVSGGWCREEGLGVGFGG